MKLLALLFFLVAILYSSVGFGGGSTYTALLVLFGVNYKLIPIVSLCCNLIVVSAGAIYFFKHQLIDKQLLTALITFSIPMSFIGGSLPISEQLFVLILGLALLLSSLLMLGTKPKESTLDTLNPSHATIHQSTAKVSYWRTGALLGAPVGLIAGITGIGGGIFLAPILHLLNIAKAKTIAATACLFILVNSIAGLTGQLNKHGFDILQSEHLKPLILLPISVLIGGLIGNRIAIKYFTPVQLRRATAVLVLIVAIRLLSRWFSY